MKTTVADFQQMIQDRLNKVEEIKNCLKLSAVSPHGNVNQKTCSDKNRKLKEVML